MRQFIHANISRLLRQKIQDAGGRVAPNGDGLQITVNGQSANLPRQDAQTGSRIAQNR
jgi:hypothetical protein